MDKPTVDEVLEGLDAAREVGTEVPNRYTAVMVTAKRARQINSYYHSLGEGSGLDSFDSPAGSQFHQELPEHRHGRSGSRRGLVQAAHEPVDRRKERSMADQPVVLLGVTGGIAAYKAAELLRGLQKAGMDVRVVMTKAATRFVGPMTFETLSTHPVRLDEISELTADSRITHIDDSQDADIMVIAPATANTLAKLANGIADNLLSSMYLAFAKTVVVAPAMNTNMWEHPATQRNVLLLRERGVFVVEPGAGELACGDYGSGRMANPDSIVAEVKLRLQVQRKRDLRGMRVMITAGGTREPIDAVRFIGNRSSGKMGFALARAAFDRGAHVELIAGQRGYA